MKSLFIICACLLAAFTLNSHAIEQSTQLNETKQTQQKKRTAATRRA
jgi:hypothetical protein